jgi:peptidoglycan/LPS O-acetylase OafA/YrhL
MGVFGVYLFFVHTCLVLMWSLDRKPHPLDFYIRRIFRIYPLAIAATLCVLAVPSTQYYLNNFHPGRNGIIENLLLIQNLSGGGYALAVMWSLPLEVDMYVFLPILFFFVRKNMALWPLLLFWTVIYGLLRHSNTSGNSFSTVILCFLPGVMAYVLYAKVKPRLPAWVFPLFLVALFVFFMHFSTVPASWPTCLALGLGLPFFRQIRLRPVQRVAHELAKHSYSVYLGHMFALDVAFYLLPIHSFWLQLTVMLTLTTLFSAVGYRVIERPMILLGARVAARAELRYELQHA